MVRRLVVLGATAVFALAGCSSSDSGQDLNDEGEPRITTAECQEIEDVESTIVKAIDDADGTASSQAAGRATLNIAIEKFRAIEGRDAGDSSEIAGYLVDSWSELAPGGNVNDAGLLLARANAQFERVCGHALPKPA